MLKSSPLKRTMTETPLDIIAEGETHCASTYGFRYWPGFDLMGENCKPIYNCLIYELSYGEHREHAVLCADVKGLQAMGITAEEAIEDFRSGVRARLEDKLGGLYPETSAFEFQEITCQAIEEGWESDGVEIILKIQTSISIFDDDK